MDARSGHATAAPPAWSSAGLRRAVRRAGFALALAGAALAAPASARAADHVTWDDDDLIAGRADTGFVGQSDRDPGGRRFRGAGRAEARPLRGMVVAVQFDPAPPADRRALHLALAAAALLAALGGLVLLWNSPLRRLVRRRTAELARSEQEHRREHDVLQSVLDSMAEGVVVADRAGRLILFNSAADQLHGGPVRSDDPREWPRAFRLYQADGVTSYPAEQLPLARALRGEACDGVEVRIDHPVEGERIAHCSGRPIRDARGEIHGAVVVIHDVTEQQRAENALRALNAALEERVRTRTAQLETANRELEAFAYSVSHELRTPLRHIKGFADILVEDHAAALGREARGYLARITAGIARMGQLIDAMLGLARLSRGELTYGAVDLSATAHAVAGELRRAHPERTVEIVIADGATVRGDARLLRQALQNLFENAWKYTATHPAARIEFGILPPAPGMAAPVFYVRDDGVGFEPDQAEGIFQPFKRLHPHLDIEGTGIGLATVQRIVRRHGGRIWAEGAPDRGATFYFTLGPDAAADAA